MSGCAHCPDRTRQSRGFHVNLQPDSSCAGALTWRQLKHRYVTLLPSEDKHFLPSAGHTTHTKTSVGRPWPRLYSLAVPARHSTMSRQRGRGAG